MKRESKKSRPAYSSFLADVGRDAQREFQSDSNGFHPFNYYFQKHLTLNSLRRSAVPITPELMRLVEHDSREVYINHAVKESIKGEDAFFMPVLDKFLSFHHNLSSRITESDFEDLKEQVEESEDFEESDYIQRVFHNYGSFRNYVDSIRPPFNFVRHRLLSPHFDIASHLIYFYYSQLIGKAVYRSALKHSTSQLEKHPEAKKLFAFDGKEQPGGKFLNLKKAVLLRAKHFLKINGFALN